MIEKIDTAAVPTRFFVYSCRSTSISLLDVTQPSQLFTLLRTRKIGRKTEGWDITLYMQNFSLIGEIGFEISWLTF